MQWLILSPPAKLGIEQAGCAAKTLKRQDSALEAETIDSTSNNSSSKSDADIEPEIKLTGSWTTVEAQKALFAESARLADAQWAANPKLSIRPAFAYRSNAVVDLWWMSPFLEAGQVRDEKEILPSMSWRDRVSVGTVFEGICPAFWGEAGNENHLM